MRQFSLRFLLLIIVAAALAAWSLGLFLPAPVDVEVRVVGFEEYDDLAGHIGFAPLVRIENKSRSAVWYWGSPTLDIEEFVDGRWTWSQSSTNQDRWISLHGNESITVSSGSIRDEATKIRVGCRFSGRRFMRSPEWVKSEVVQVLRRRAAEK